MSKSGGPPERAEARRSISRSPSIPDRCRSPQVVATCGGFGSVERRGTTGGFRSRLALCQLRLAHLQADGPPTERRTLGGLGYPFRLDPFLVFLGRAPAFRPPFSE